MCGFSMVIEMKGTEPPSLFAVFSSFVESAAQIDERSDAEMIVELPGWVMLLSVECNVFIDKNI